MLATTLIRALALVAVFAFAAAGSAEASAYCPGDGDKPTEPTTYCPGDGDKPTEPTTSALATGISPQSQPPEVGLGRAEIAASVGPQDAVFDGSLTPACAPLFATDSGALS